jgi:hypothetical protein
MKRRDVIQLGLGVLFFDLLVACDPVSAVIKPKSMPRIAYFSGDRRMHWMRLDARPSSKG